MKSENKSDRENASVKTESEGTGDVTALDMKDLELAKDTTAFDQTTGISGWHQFFQKSFYQVISKAEDDNCIYSPVNLYLCLAMLSEISDGDTRTQITNLLGQDNQKKIRRQSQELFWDASRVVTCPVGEPEPSSINFESAWKNPFSKKKIKEGVFHGVISDSNIILAWICCPIPKRVSCALAD